jgi:S-formylglutathione hydrolase FrmB
MASRRRKISGIVVTVVLITVVGIIAIFHWSPRAQEWLANTRFHVRVLRGSSAIPTKNSKRLIEESIQDLNGKSRTLWIYRPTTHDSSHLPILYMLHGVPGESIDTFESGVAQSMDDWIAGGGRPFEIVCPDGNGEHHSDTEWANAYDHSDRVESYVIDRVIPAVEAGHSRTRANRAIGGFSMGGYGAANLALRHPDQFGQVVSFDGYFHVDDPDHMFNNDQKLIDANSPDQHVDKARNTPMLLIEDTSGEEPVVTGEATRFGNLVNSSGGSAQVHIANGSHNWAFVDSQFNVAQQFLTQHWPPRHH